MIFLFVLFSRFSHAICNSQLVEPPPSPPPPLLRASGESLRFFFCVWGGGGGGEKCVAGHIQSFENIDLTYLPTLLRRRQFQAQLSLNSQAPRRGWGWGGFSPPPPPPLFWLIKLLFQFFSKVLHKKVHRVILCQTCGPQRKHCFFLIAPFRSNTSIS